MGKDVQRTTCQAAAPCQLWSPWTPCLWCLTQLGSRESGLVRLSWAIFPPPPVFWLVFILDLSKKASRPASWTWIWSELSHSNRERWYVSICCLGMTIWSESLELWAYSVCFQSNLIRNLCPWSGVCSLGMFMVDISMRIQWYSMVFNGIQWLTGWWFGTFYIFPYTGNVIIPIDFHIFQRGSYTTNQWKMWLYTNF